MGKLFTLDRDNLIENRDTQGDSETTPKQLLKRGRLPTVLLGDSDKLERNIAYAHVRAVLADGEVVPSPTSAVTPEGEVVEAGEVVALELTQGSIEVIRQIGDFAVQEDHSLAFVERSLF